MSNIITRSQAKDQGLKHYFTGKKCKHGHISKRRTRDSKCLECDKVRNVQFRKDHPEVLKQWREANPDYASEKYHENKDVRKQQSKEWYNNNRDSALEQHKEWYYNPDNQDMIQQSRKQWYKSNPNYDINYRKLNSTKLLSAWAPGWRKRYYTKRRQQIQERFQSLAIDYILPDDFSERDLKYWLAGEIITRTGWFVFKEYFIDSNNTARIDLLIPEQKIGIELKLNNMYGNTNESIKQQERYQLHLPDYQIFLVSLDGSVGISVKQLLDQII